MLQVKRMICFAALLAIVTGCVGLAVSVVALSPSSSHALRSVAPLADDPNSPASTVKLIFIHHSCGENWLADDDGGLGIALYDKNYFVSDTNYGWGPDSIGDNTDIGHWWDWFRGSSSSTYLSALYTEYGDHSYNYTRLTDPDPSRENEIIMFKSCYPNSNLGGNADDPPTTGSNPLRGQESGSEYHTVANAKGIYNDLLVYFAAHQEKLFVVITAPPVTPGDSWEPPANARAFNDWLVDDWLDGYPHDNVAVFDFYNVLTSNGGNANTNDRGQEDGNHHRWWNEAVQHRQTVDNDLASYGGGSGGGSHPTAAGNQKAAAEFVPLLNVYYNRWQGGETYTFHAIITPTNATLPIIYNWSPEPTSGQGTDSATYHWPPGTYDIALAATNCGGTFTATRTVTVGSSQLVAQSRSVTGVFPQHATAQQTMAFQDGVSPDASYAGTRDVILASDYANDNLGATTHLETYYGGGTEHRSLIRWDLSDLPADITVNGAAVELYRYEENTENDMQLNLHRVTREWTEGDGDFTPSPGGATWITATAGVAWTTPGGDYDTTIVGQTTLPTDMEDGWVRVDATTAVQDWVEGSASNYGLLLLPTSGEWTFHYFHSREAVTATLRPRLVVTYTTGAPAPALNITAPTGSTRWPVSSTQQIRWTTTGTVSQVNLAYSINDVTTTIDTAVANTGVYTWKTPPTATTSARVRVESAISPTTVYDVSDPFTLYETGVATSTIHLPLVLRNHAPQPSCPYPLTGVAISDPTMQGHRIYPANLTYKGAFAYPSGDGWAYSGHALAYYPEGDPGPADSYPGSLYAAGHTHDDLVGEITIPEPVIADNFDDLPEASVLQSLTDITGGWKDNCTYNDDCIYREVDGLEYLPNINKIAWNLRDWYNVTAYDQDSLGWSDLDMTAAQGVWHIGERPSDNYEFHNAKTCDYLFKAPENFANQFLDGKWLVAGNHRGAGAFGGSQGPTLYALAPWEDGNPPESGQNLEALTLLYYPTIYPECYDNPDECYFPDYRAMDNWGGGVWVQTATGSAVLIFGRKGLGDNCYGTPEHCGGDPCEVYKGYHAYPYEPQILFYDPEELREVRAGTRELWEVLPYEVYSPVDEVFDQECATFGAVAYDQERGLIYVTEQEAGPWGETVVHVWKVGG